MGNIKSQKEDAAPPSQQARAYADASIMMTGESFLSSEDRRFIVNRYYYNPIGRIRVRIGSKCFTGTGTIVKVSTLPDGRIHLVVLTCAHNCVRVDLDGNVTTAASEIEFQSRYNFMWPLYCYYKLPVVKVDVFPDYKFPGDFDQDLAVLTVDAGYIKEFVNVMPVAIMVLDPERHVGKFVAVVGCPGEEGKVLLKGHVGQIQKISRTKTYLEYEVDTTGGQSGSPIVANNCEYLFGKGRLPAESSLIPDEDWVLSEGFVMCGVHTFGGSYGNGGCYFDAKKCEWLHQRYEIYIYKLRNLVRGAVIQ